MNCIKGKILTDQGFKPGYILQKEQETPTLHFGNYTGSFSKKGFIIPTLINAHTHIGDTFIRQKNIELPRNIQSLVAPPDGLKHRLLKNTNHDEIIEGIINGLHELEREGIDTFVDFRENGLKGIYLLKKALEKVTLHSLILSRPSTHHTTSTELDQLLSESDGIGLSSIEDYDFEEVAYIAEYTNKARKLLSLHVSERFREKIEFILNLNPDFIIHMTHASRKDLELVKEHKIPIVVCPRSNHFFGMKANLENMKKIGNIILLGTDNFMFHTPSILEEIRFIQTHFPKLFSLEELLVMMTYEARKALNLKDNIPGSTFPTSWIAIEPNNYQITTVLKKVEEG